MRALGFRITSFELATTSRPGMIKGVKELKGVDARTQHGVVTIECTATGVNFNAREEGKILRQIEMKRGFLIAYKSVVGMAKRHREMEAKIAAGTAPPRWRKKALQVLVRPIAGQAAKLDFHLDMAAAGVLPVRITIKNPTEHRYGLDATTIQLSRADRHRVAALSVDDVAARVAGARDPETGHPITSQSVAALRRRLLEKLFVGGKVAPGGGRDGYLFFPEDEYKRAKVVLIEEESGEAEGFLVEF